MAAPETDGEAGRRDRFVWRQDEFDEALARGCELLPSPTPATETESSSGAPRTPNGEPSPMPKVPRAN